MDEKLDDLIHSYILKNKFMDTFGKDPEGCFSIDGISNYPLSLLLLDSYQRSKRRIFCIFPTEEALKERAKELEGKTDNLIVYPGSGKLLYSPFTMNKAELDEKDALERIGESDSFLALFSLRSFLSPCLGLNAITEHSLKFSVGDEYDPLSVIERLNETGYQRTSFCNDEGTYALRGEVLDIFPFSRTYPIRIYSEWDKIERIREYDPLSQKALKDIRSFSVSVGSSSLVLNSHIDQYIRAGDLFFLIGSERLETARKAILKEAGERYKEEYRKREDVLSPDKLLLDFDTFFANRSGVTTIHDIRNEDAFHFSVSPSRSYFGNLTYFKDDTLSLLKNEWKVFVIAPSEVQKERLDSVLSSMDVSIMINDLSSGFSIDDEKILVTLDAEIFGRKRRKVERISQIESAPLDSFVDLKEGDYVVHVNYGIGQFEKIERVKAFDTERDYIKIKYLSDEYLYVPIEQANLVQKYIGNDGKPPKLDSMGSTSWTKKKEKARKSAEKLASELVRLYAERSEAEGYPFEKDTDWQLQFEASFPYSETPDQIKCLEEIKADMETKKVMDRLICGDVGYGKTELAFRAAFKAVLSGKQVAFLAPTVVLAEQHYQNFMERSSSFPIRCAILTRFTSTREASRIKNEISTGGIDILFGTHRILRGLRFSDLGLLIVDEEQRFGVKDKERIKEMKTNVDCLTLSATPIPRTLYMSLLKVRDMSLLTTAPRERLPVETYIGEYDPHLVENAIRNELQRAGQVFFLHNRIEDLDDVASEIKRAIPSAIVESAHGQMDSEELEDKMHRFVYGGVQVLVSTTIIENGIDIPNVNTIIIDRAERLGLSQLYQLRGRVGRSDRKAYCYLFYPDKSALTDDAIKRLRVMSENTALGSGFKIAMKDMEFRGAGNILGREQSGHLEAVGLDMYLKLLGEEVDRLTSENKETPREVFLELEYTGFIPDSYISDASVKFDLYKKIASVSSRESLDSLRSEITDRFGPLPEEVDNLFCIAEIKILMRALSIYHAYERRGEITFVLDKVAAINVSKLVTLVTLSAGRVRISPSSDKIIMKTDTFSLKDKALFILEELRRLL